VFQQSCFSIYVSSSVIQQLCFSIYVSSSVIQQLCFSIHVPTVVFHHSCSSSRVPASVIQPTSVFALVLQHLCSCFSNCVPASAIVFQLLCSNTCACSITNRLSSMTTLTICVSFCVPTLFQHCVSASVFAFVLQRLCFSFCVCICVAASVFQLLCLHLCCSVCVSASVFLHLFSIHNRLPSMTTLIICVIFAVAIFPTIVL
jgi:hypothetical protein